MVYAFQRAWEFLDQLLCLHESVQHVRDLIPSDRQYRSEGPSARYKCLFCGKRLHR